MALRPSPLTYLPLFDRALDEEIGIAFMVDIPRESFRNELYKARKMSGDPRYKDLIIFCPNNGEIFIAKKAVELDQ